MNNVYKDMRAKGEISFKLVNPNGKSNKIFHSNRQMWEWIYFTEVGDDDDDDDDVDESPKKPQSPTQELPEQFVLGASVKQYIDGE